MAQHDEEICLRLQVLNPQGQPLGGTVDIACKLPSEAQASYIHAANAAQEIDLRGLRRDATEPYEVTVTQTGTNLSATQMVSVPASGSAVVKCIVGAAPTNSLNGTLVLDNGLPAAGVTIHLYSVGFGGQDTLLGATQSGANGAYSIRYTPQGATNLQVRALDPTRKEVTLSTTQYNASTTAALNLAVPSSVSPSAAEFQMLSTSMTKSINGVTRLAVAQESAGQQDLTLLNRSTNWDARITALGALAAQHSQTTGIGQEGLYTMFRAGLPSDPAALATIPPATVQQALTTASAAGITSMTADQIQVTVTAFTGFAKQSQLATIPSGGLSAIAQMAAAHIKDATQQAAFTNLYFSSGTSGDFWTSAAQLGIPAETLDSLKLQGKFLYLTFNNVPLASALQSQIGQAASLSQLAGKDFDTSATWQATLQTVANNTPGSSIDSLIPSAYTGATTADRLAAYTGDMARKVRLSFPTEVTARMIERQQLNVKGATAAPAATFLRAAAGLGYSRGRTPAQRVSREFRRPTSGARRGHSRNR